MNFPCRDPVRPQARQPEEGRQRAGQLPNKLPRNFLHVNMLRHAHVSSPSPFPWLTVKGENRRLQTPSYACLAPQISFIKPLQSLRCFSRATCAGQRCWRIDERSDFRDRSWSCKKLGWQSCWEGKAQTPSNQAEYQGTRQQGATFGGQQAAARASARCPSAQGTGWAGTAWLSALVVFRAA